MSTRTERWSVELILRYLCATLVTCIAAAGAQLIVRNDFIFVVLFITILGAPVSLYLRLHSMRVAGFSLSRPLWNTFTVVVFFVCAGIWTISSMSDLFGLLLSGASQSFWIRFGAEGSLALLMQVFLLFAAFRSYALISDKDTTLATVPSFSVLLLLVPVHRGIEVVLYFLLWTLVSTTLFALDHRAELHTGTNGIVLAPSPGQDVRMAARGLATVLGAALFAAFGLSALLTSRNADDRSATETAITNLVGRLAQFAMSSPDSSSNSGPERQIDFSSGPNIPSRALLWKVRARNIQGEGIQPSYFRLLTLSQYNGSTWTQTTRNQRQISNKHLTQRDSWFPPFGQNNFGMFPAFPNPRRPSRFDRRFDNRLVQVAPPNPNSATSFRRFNPLPPLPNGGSIFPDQGFAIRETWPKTFNSYGSPTARVRFRISSSSINLGYIPLLPGVRALFTFNNNRVDEIRAGKDGSVDFGFIQQDQSISSINDLPQLAEYGFSARTPPSKNVAAASNAPQLDEDERRLYLNLPPLSQRTLLFAKQTLAKSSKDENAYGRAQRLALAIQRGATYTLHPPIPPTGHEATDFFLFDGNRRGYCTHFASALAVLCRSQGIPARIVSGFAAQEYSSDGVAMLRDANAHAWTEVWIDNWGWALVDATPASDRGDNAPNFFSYWGDWIGFIFNQIELWSRSRLWIFGVLAGTFVIGVYAFRRRERIQAWWAHRRGHISTDDWTRREIIVAYDQAALRLAHLFRPRADFETPDEWLSAASEALSHAPRAKPFAYQEFEQLTRLYLRALYAPNAPAEETVSSARGLTRLIRNKKKAASS